MRDPARFSRSDLLVLSARAVGKVDAFGPRGATLVSRDEVEAMACLLATFGLVPIPPGGPVPETLLIPVEGAFK